MNKHRVELTPGAIADLVEIWQYVARRSSEAMADKFIRSIRAACEDLQIAPVRGILRPELGEGIRMIGVAKGRVALIFRVETGVVSLIGIDYAGKLHEPR